MIKTHGPSNLASPSSSPQLDCLYEYVHVQPKDERADLKVLSSEMDPAEIRLIR